MKKVRIGIVLSSTPAYSETFFRSKIKGLQRHGHEVVLITSHKALTFDLCENLNHPKVYQSTAIQILMMFKVFFGLSFYYKRVFAYYKLERKEKTSLKRILEKIYLNGTLLKIDVDWLHFGFATMTIDRELVAKAIGAKMGVSFRGFDINVYPIKNPDCYKKLWNYVDAVHSISIDLWQKACDLGLPITKPYKIITPAVNAAIIGKYIQNNEVHIPVEMLTIARLHYIKGIDILVDTAKILKDKGLHFKWRVVGDGDASDLERYRYHIHESGLKDMVILEGKKIHEESLMLLEQANLYVQTSYSEGFCNALLEAQAKGKLCVAFNTGGIPENVLHGKTGYLVDTVSAHTLANQIIETMTLSQQEKKIISENALKRVKQDFTLEKQQQAFVAFYDVKI
jgi:colanic acid/amylovoran biosynthesis glycosyltransferase